MTITSSEPFIEQAIHEEKSIGQIMIEHEAEIQQVSEAEVIAGMKKIWLVMKNSIIQGLKITERSPSGMSGGMLTSF